MPHLLQEIEILKGDYLYIPVEKHIRGGVFVVIGPRYVEKKRK